MGAHTVSRGRRPTGGRLRGRRASRRELETRALDAIRQLVRALRLAARAAEREVGLSAAQLFVLQQLSDAPAASINDLAARTLTHQSSVSVVVRRLVDGGLAAKATASDDARRVTIAITPAGRAALRRAPVPLQSRLIDVLERLSRARLTALVAGLENLVRAVGAAHPPAPMLFEDEAQRAPVRR